MNLERDLVKSLPQEMRYAYSGLVSFFGDLTYQEFNALTWSYGLYLLKPDAAELNLDEAITQRTRSRFPDCSVMTYPGIAVPKLDGVSVAEFVYPINFKSLSSGMPDVARCMDEYLASGTMSVVSVSDTSLQNRCLSSAMEELRGPGLKEAFNVEGNFGLGYVENTLRGMQYANLGPEQVYDLRRATSTGTIYDRTRVTQRNLVHFPDCPEEMIGVLALLPHVLQTEEISRMRTAINLTNARKRSLLPEPIYKLQ